jgi:hypothetical protein
MHGVYRPLSDTSSLTPGGTLAPDLHVMSAIRPIGRMSVGGRNSSRFLQGHRADVAALLATLGAPQALFHRLERGVPSAQMG